MPNFQQFQGFRGVADVFLRDPELYLPLLQFLERVMTRPSELSIAEREMLATRVSELNGCGFCVAAHQAALDAMGSGDAANPRPQFQALLKLAETLTRTPDVFGQADVEAALQAGWSEQAVEDAVNVVGLFNYINRLVDAAGIEADTDYCRQTGEALAEKGYAFLLGMVSKKLG